MNFGPKYIYVIVALAVLAVGVLTILFIKNTNPPAPLQTSATGETPSQTLAAKYSASVSLVAISSDVLTVSTIPSSTSTWRVRVSGKTEVTKSGKSIKLGDLKPGNSLNILMDKDLMGSDQATAVKVEVIQ